EIFRTSTPRFRSSRTRNKAFSSRVLPERISLPMTTIPAVFAIIRSNIACERNCPTRDVVLSYSDYMKRLQARGARSQRTGFFGDITRTVVRGHASERL